jgi:F-type H+-transporting ATPase subunit b
MLREADASLQNAQGKTMFVTPGYAQETAPASTDPHATAPGEPAADAHDASGHGTEVGHSEGGGVFPPFDPEHFPSSILWLAITFGLFYLFLKKVIVPRIGGILEVRSDRIAADLDQAARMKAEADAAIAAYEQELAEARKNSSAIAQKARDAAKAEAEDARKTVEAGLEKRLAEAEARISAIKTAAMKDVGSIAEDTASAIVEQLAGKSAADKAAIAAAVKAGRE